MAIGPLFNPLIRIDGVDLSDHATKVTINQEADEVDVTAFNPDATKAMRRGLITGSVEVEFLQDFESQQVNDVLAPLFDSGDPFWVYIQADADLPLSSTNPGWQSRCILTSFNPLDAGVGEASKTTVTFPLYEGKVQQVESGTYS